MVCIEKCLHFKRKCRHHPHPILDILPVYLTRGISLTGGIDFSSEVQNFMIRFIIETIMPIYRKEQVNGFTM